MPVSVTISLIGCTTLMLLLPPPTAADTIKVAYLSRFGPNFGRIGKRTDFECTAAAVSLAIEDYQANIGLRNYSIEVLNVKDILCDPGIDMKLMAELYFKEKPDAFFGLTCGDHIVPLAKYYAHWKIPFFPIGGLEAELSDKTTYSTLIRVQASGGKMAVAFTKMFKDYGWKRAALVMTEGPGGCDKSGSAIYTALTGMGVTLTDWITTPETPTEDYLLSNYLDRVRERARIIIFCHRYSLSRLAFLRLAHEKGMRAPHYAFLHYGISVSLKYSEPWTEIPDIKPAEVKQWQKILVEINYKQVFMMTLTGPVFDKFYKRVPFAMTLPPWNYNATLELGLTITIRTADVYDMTLVYLTSLEEVMNSGADWRDGELIANNLKGKVVHDALRGNMMFDEKFDIEPNFWVLDIHPGWTEYKEVLQISLDRPLGKQFIPLHNRSLHWGTEGNLPPLDTPLCGFKNEFCQVEEAEIGIVTVASSTIVGMFLVITVICLILYRRQKEEEEARLTMWKVDFNEIHIGKTRAGSVANMSQRSIKSDNSMDGEAQDIRQLFTEVGTYRGNLVAILRVNKPRVDLTLIDLKELKSMKDMNHDNLAVFVGASITPPNVCYLMVYYTKGSLLDIIENEIIGLDWMFKTSLISDLVNGMAYLHRSELGSHGSLKSSCCLVNSRWQLKVSSFGLHAFRTAGAEDEQQKYRKLLWTAPELLRLPRSAWPRYGTQTADVYSFGVIAQEVIYRTGPYFLDMEQPKDVITKLSRGHPDLYRPVLPKVEEDTPPEAAQLVEGCWQEDPTLRPNFEDLKKQIKELNKGKSVDIMSSLIEKLEKYANNLEDIVNQRTAELVLEKKRTDKLLESMLPPSVVEELKHGRTVDAELFELVTIFFSDIVGFTALSLESSPIEVVNLLNDLYTLFDDIIHTHDVYKMETIGDSYMVVSGLPKRNGAKHVGEIANLALDLMSSALIFRIRHRRGLRLQLRIGLHTGPCAAGVVGLAMPRYCLFGDTVNMASRMETNGKALMIHMSKYAFAALDQLGGYSFRPRGEMQIKGKGLQMTYWLLGKDGFQKKLPAFDK